MASILGRNVFLVVNILLSIEDLMGDKFNEQSVHAARYLFA